MTGFDIAVLVIVGLAAITGFMRGFVQEILALAAWVLALVAIHALHPVLTTLLLPYVKSASGSQVLAFAILLLVPYAATKFIANRLGSATRNSVIGPIDRLLGFGFGAVKGTVIIVLAFSIVALGYDVAWGKAGRPTWITGSRTYPFINACSEKLVTAIGERRREATGASADESAPTDQAPIDQAGATPTPSPGRHRHHRVHTE
jgi:membrane protein required for colicin V production